MSEIGKLGKKASLVVHRQQSSPQLDLMSIKLSIDFISGDLTQMCCLACLLVFQVKAGFKNLTDVKKKCFTKYLRHSSATLAVRVHSIEQDVSAVCDETIEHGFHGFVEKTKSFASAIGAVSIEIRSKRVVIFLTVKLKAELLE